MEGISIEKTPEYYLYLELRKKYEKIYQKQKTTTMIKLITFIINFLTFCISFWLLLFSFMATFICTLIREDNTFMINFMKNVHHLFNKGINK